MPIKLKVKIFKISLVINYLRFGVWGFDFILALDIPNEVFSKKSHFYLFPQKTKKSHFSRNNLTERSDTFDDAISKKIEKPLFCKSSLIITLLCDVINSNF